MLETHIRLDYPHRVLFTREAFSPKNSVVRDLLNLGNPAKKNRVLVFADERVTQANPSLANEVRAYAQHHQDCIELANEVIVLPGGEACKNDFELVKNCWESIHSAALDRHSFVFVIGGGAILDLVCFAASTAHRGIRHIRFPTTTLSQGDGGVGVKNGVNFFGKKNWVGTFSIPYAVVNDFTFLESLPERERRNGIIEAIKVAMIRDAAFFHEMEALAAPLASLQQTALERVVRRSAELHIEHISTSGDPFELGSARPLDFGHWAAHKLEQITEFSVTHGEAVAIGMALDIVYSVRIGLMDAATAQRALDLIEKVGFATFHPGLEKSGLSGENVILEGLEEFREHLGGELTITLVPKIGEKQEVHQMEREQILHALKDLRLRALK